MRKTMKKLMSLLVAGTLCFSLAACGNTENGGANDITGGGNGTVVTPDGSQGENQGNSGETTGDGNFLSNVEGLPETLENPNLKIVYWYNPAQYKYDTSKFPTVYDPILEAIPFFEEKYGGTVEIIYSGWGDMIETVVSLQNANEAPDLFEVYDETCYSTILAGVSRPLDDIVTDLDYSYYDVSRDLFSWEGSTYAIPLKPYIFNMAFNRDLFDLEGLPSPDELFKEGNWNWTTFKEACKALTKTVDGETVQSAFGSYKDAITSFMYTNGTQMLNVDTKTGTVTSNLSDVKMQNTLNYLVELKDYLMLVETEDEFTSAFDNGTLAMTRSYADEADLPFEMGLVPFPAGDDYEGKNLLAYPQAMSIPNGAKNPEGAVAFMRIVNEVQKEIGDKKEAERIGQDVYDMIYADDVKLAYAYDKSIEDVGTIIASICNYINDGVPAATIIANMEPELQSKIDMMYGDK